MVDCLAATGATPSIVLPLVGVLLIIAGGTAWAVTKGRRGRGTALVVVLCLVASTALASTAAGSAHAAATAKECTSSAGDTGSGASPTPSPDPDPAPPDPDPDPDPDQPTLPAGSTNEIFDEAGNLRMPMPQLADETSVERDEDGTAVVQARLGFDVSNTISRAGVRQDSAIVHVMVSESLGAGGGPLRSVNPLFSQVLVESDLDAPHVERQYRVRLPADVVAFLDTKGFASEDAAIRRAALVYVDIDVQQMRDFKIVDGEWDWQQGRAWTAADLPVRVADNTDSSTITVNNATGEGVYLPTTIQNFDTVSQTSWERISDTDDFAAPIGLSGQSVQCIAQGNGSNPQGFALLNGWDIEYGLAPGTVPAGASVTQTVVADDSLGLPTNDIIEDTGSAAVLTTAAAMDLTTPGIKSAAQYTYMLALGLTEVSLSATVALGVPIEAIVELGFAIDHTATDSCADFANIVNIAAVEPSGAQTSVSWADQTDGLTDMYDSATYNGSPVTDSVTVAKSTGTMTGVLNAQTYAVNPYLAQDATVACGDAIECSNNVIDVQWSAANPCPQLNVADCLPSPAQVASPQITVPGTSLCGVDNALCPPAAAPKSSASDVPVTADIAGTEGSPYAVLVEDQPSAAITAMAVDDAGNLYLGGADGTLTKRTPTGVQSPILEFDSAVTAMTTIDDLIYVAEQSGGLWVYPATGYDGPMDAGGFANGDYITKIVGTGNGTAYYSTTAADLYFLPAFDPDSPDFGTGNLVVPSTSWQNSDANLNNQPITSMATDESILFVGFADGYVTRCDLTDCFASTQLWVDAAALPDVEGNGDLVTFSAQALELVGDALYLGGSDGSLWQIDADNGDVTTIQTVGTDSAQVAGLALADGALYVGGCFGVESPITSDMLGVFTIAELDGENSVYGVPPGVNENYTDSCINPSSTTSHYKGFDPSSYQMVLSKPDPALPAVVYVSFSIDTGNFFYALQNTSVPTVGVCDSACPPETLPSTYETNATTTPGPPAAGLSGIGAPTILSSCGAQGSSYTPTSGGFELSGVGSADADCTIQYSWNLNDVGTLPYRYWGATAIAESADTVPLYVTAGWDIGDYTATSPIGTEVQWLFAPVLLTTDPADIVEPYPFPDVAYVQSNGQSILAPVPATTSTAAGLPLAVPLTGTGQLVLTLDIPQGADPSVITFTGDSLSTTGTVPGLCQPFDVSLLGSGALFYVLNDTGAVAFDLTGNGFEGAISTPLAQNVPGGPSQACPEDGALAFDGESTSVSASGAASSLTEGAQLTVMAWIQIPPGTVSADSRIIANDHTDETYKGFQLALNSEATGGSFYVGATGGTTSAVWSSEETITPGVWHQFTGVYDGSTVTVYFDGLAVGTGHTSGTIKPGQYDVQLGYEPQGDTDHFTGQMADVLVSDHALSAADIATIYTQISGLAPGVIAPVP